MKIEFAQMLSGQELYFYTLENKNGMSVTLTNYGATITSIMTPDKNGVFDSVVLGYDTMQDYVDTRSFFGTTVGRYANRIAGGKFSLDGTEYTLKCNEGEVHLHGGIKGYDKVIWSEGLAPDDENESICLTYYSKDGEEGYPGNLDVAVTFTLDDDNKIWINYKATTDKKTIVNLTNHSFFNLGGHKSGNVNGHRLLIHADKYSPINERFIPLGENESVEGTPFDFRTFTPIGERLFDDNVQLARGRGYDHNFVINGEDFRVHAKVYDPKSGRLMTVYSEEPCIQFYGCGQIDSVKGKDNAVYEKYGAICMETQHAPDSPNNKNFPSVELSPGELYDTTTCYQFEVKDTVD